MKYVVNMADPYSAWFIDALEEWSDFIPVKWEETTIIQQADLIVGWGDFDNPHGIAYTNPILFTTLVAFDPQATDNFYEIALHEIGHVLGLDHYDGADAVMNSSGGSDTGHLTDADIEHVQDLYPYSWYYGWHIEPNWGIRLVLGRRLVLVVFRDVWLVRLVVVYRGLVVRVARGADLGLRMVARMSAPRVRGAR